MNIVTTNPFLELRVFLELKHNGKLLILTLFNLFFFRHEVDSHGLLAEISEGERDSFGYFKCRAACGYVYSTRSKRNRYTHFK